MAMLDDATAALIDGAYAAALDDALWEPWSLAMAHAFGSRGSVLFAMERPEGTPRRLHLGLFCPRTVEEYVGGMGLLDPQLAHVSRLPGRSCTYVDTDHVDREHPPTAEYMAWSASAAKVKHHVTGVAFLDGGGVAAGLSLNLGSADGPVSAAQRARFDAIFAEVVRAMELGFIHGEKLEEAYWEGMAAGFRDPALLLDERGRVLRMTAAAEALLASGDGLAVSGGRLRARSRADDERLTALVGRAVARDGASAGAAGVTRRSGRSPFLLTAFPLPRRDRMLAPAEAAALVTLVDPAAAPRAPAALYTQAFGLTPREADVAAALMTGHSVESAAAALGMSVATARIHLRHLFAKTDTTRQAELVRLLARVPAADTPFG